ncbi:MAG: 2,3-bisphosphoglycerate-independent phosphoglycerate mutase [Wenzhouxiangellaceae bacterium]
MLLILDGWGCRDNGDDNAISVTDTPHWDALLATCPHTRLETSGEAVGLPAGQMGNSEVGHMNIGAGRVVYQDLTRISRALADGDVARHPALRAMVQDLQQQNATLHLMGLLSPGGVHSHEDHWFAMLRILAELGAPAIAVHAFLDGRDTPPRSARESLLKLQAIASELPAVRIASVSGRYYAMDRDERWPRIELAYQAIVEADAEHQADIAVAALEAAYARDEGDEFVKPTLIDGGCRINDRDAVLFMNFRADRARQLCRALVEPGFSGFKARRPRLSHMLGLTEYLSSLPMTILFPPEQLHQLLGEVLAKAGLRQLRIAETEKYAHVTFFFNGGMEQPFSGEDRILIPSPDVATYDLQPEMSAPELTRQLLAAIGGGDYQVIICNVANPDMVGHTGDFQAAQQAVQAVDQLLGAVATAIREAGGELLITADHGNIEQMRDDASGQPHTAHTTNPVPLLYLGRQAVARGPGSLRDIAPTMLDLLGLAQPEAMTGQPLFQLTDRKAAAA